MPGDKRHSTDPDVKRKRTNGLGNRENFSPNLNLNSVPPAPIKRRASRFFFSPTRSKDVTRSGKTPPTAIAEREATKEASTSVLRVEFGVQLEQGESEERNTVVRQLSLDAETLEEQEGTRPHITKQIFNWTANPDIPQEVKERRRKRQRRDLRAATSAKDTTIEATFHKCHLNAVCLSQNTVTIGESQSTTFPGTAASNYNQFTAFESVLKDALQENKLINAQLRSTLYTETSISPDTPIPVMHKIELLSVGVEHADGATKQVPTKVRMFIFPRCTKKLTETESNTIANDVKQHIKECIETNLQPIKRLDQAFSDAMDSDTDSVAKISRDSYEANLLSTLTGTAGRATAYLYSFFCQHKPSEEASASASASTPSLK